MPRRSLLGFESSWLVYRARRAGDRPVICIVLLTLFYHALQSPLLLQGEQRSLVATEAGRIV
jgi:hypothetical protein